MRNLLAILTLLSILAIMGCTSEPEPDIEATVAAAIAATQTAAPTDTPVPTPTPTATDTPTPTSTATDTPTPTSTATATPMPEPTNTPLPAESSAPASAIVESQLETGDTLYELPAEGFSIALPQDWQVVDLDKMDFANIFGAVGEQNENLSDLFSSSLFQNLVAAGIRFFAINLNEDSLQATAPATINVLKQELPIAPSMDMFITINVAQLEQFFDLTSEIKQEQIMLGDVETTKISYTTNIVDPLNQEIEAFNTQYLILDGSTAYIVTLSMPVELADEYSQPFSEAVETFRLIGE